MENAIAQRRGHDDAGGHGAKKQRPADAQQDYIAVIAEKMNSFPYFAPEALQAALGSNDFGAQFRRSRHHVAALAHGEIA